MTKAKMVLLAEVRKLKSKIFNKKRELDKLENEVEELEFQTEQLD